MGSSLDDARDFVEPMERLETRNLLSLSLTILTGVDGETVGALITGDGAADAIYAQYDTVTRRITVNPDAEALLLDEAVVTLLIDAGPGDDFVSVRGGRGVVQYVAQGGPGNDTLKGGNGNDWLEGGEGDDWIAGSVGRDYLVGGPGDDTLAGARGDDVLIGGEGVDELWGGAGFDTGYFASVDVVTLAESLIADDDLDGATPPQIIDPNEVVTPPCPPECPLD